MTGDEIRAVLCRPFTLGALELQSRVVMAPMTRSLSPGGIPGPASADYYRRRAEHGVGLIVTEGTYVDHAGASIDPNAPSFYGEAALDGWARVLAAVHGAGGRIFPQLWHVGLIEPTAIDGLFADVPGLRADQVGPSGMVGGLAKPPRRSAAPMSQRDIDDVVESFARGAENAYRLGFDGVELHGAHGYLLDQFFWGETNDRSDRYGGLIVRRSRFAAEIVAEIKRRTDPAFPVSLRISQWKQHDYDAKMVASPTELEAFLRPLVDAGVDIFHCSQRRYWEPEFAGSDLNLAGQVKRVSGVPTISVGSVGLSDDLMNTLFVGRGSSARDIADLIEMMARDEFDLIAVGRALLADPAWLDKILAGETGALRPYAPAMLATLD